MRAEIPIHVNARNVGLVVEVNDILRGEGTVAVA